MQGGFSMQSLIGMLEIHIGMHAEMWDFTCVFQDFKTAMTL